MEAAISIKKKEIKETLYPISFIYIWTKFEH